MVGKPKHPKGIRPHGRGIQIRLYGNGKQIHTETAPGDIYNKADLASAVKRRDWLASRYKLGLPLTNQDTAAARQLFHQCAQSYLDSLDAKHSTQISYENILNTFWMPIFANWPIDEISKAEIKKRVATFNVSSKTKRNRLIPLIGVFENAEIEPNPARGIRLKKTQKEEIERYTPSERAKLLKQLNGQSKVYFAVIFGCGLRPGGEPLALQWSDYDGEQISITKQITRRRLEKTTKNSIARKVFVPTWVRQILNKHDTRFAGESIFVNSKGRGYLDSDAFNAAWKAAHKRARIPYRIPYVCRHTRASELLSIGIAPADAAKQMGHSYEMFVRIYARFIEEFSGDSDLSRFEGIGIDATGKT